MELLYEFSALIIVLIFYDMYNRGRLEKMDQRQYNLLEEIDSLDLKIDQMQEEIVLLNQTINDLRNLETDEAHELSKYDHNYEQVTGI